MLDRATRPPASSAPAFTPGRVGLGDGRARVRGRGVAHRPRARARRASPCEVVSRHGARVDLDAQAAGARARARSSLGGRARDVDAARPRRRLRRLPRARTAWQWSPASARRADGGRRLRGTSSPASTTRRRQRAQRLGRRGRARAGAGRVRRGPRPSAFADGSRLRFTRGGASARATTTSGSSRSDYRQPFGAFAGTLPGGVAARPGARRDGAPRRALVDAAAQPRPPEVGRRCSVGRSVIGPRAGEDFGSRRSCVLRRRTLVACVAAVAALLVAAGSASAVTYPPDYSAPNQAWNVLPPGEAGSNPSGSQLVQPGPALRRPHPELRHGDRRVAARLLQEERLRPRRRVARQHVQPARAIPASSIERDSKGVAHITGADARRRDVRHRLRELPGPRAAHGAAARTVAAGGDRRPRHQPLRDPQRGTQLHAVRADRGLPRVAGAAAAEPRPGRAADHRRRRRLRRRASTLARTPASRRRPGRATT